MVAFFVIMLEQWFLAKKRKKERKRSKSAFRQGSTYIFFYPSFKVLIQHALYGYKIILVPMAAYVNASSMFYVLLLVILEVLIGMLTEVSVLQI